MYWSFSLGSKWTKKFVLLEKQRDGTSGEEEKTDGNQKEEAQQPRKKIFKDLQGRPRGQEEKTSTGGELPDIPTDQNDPQPSTSGYSNQKKPTKSGVNRY